MYSKVLDLIHTVEQGLTFRAGLQQHLGLTMLEIHADIYSDFNYGQHTWQPLSFSLQGSAVAEEK